MYIGIAINIKTAIDINITISPCFTRFLAMRTKPEINPKGGNKNAKMYAKKIVEEPTLTVFFLSVCFPLFDAFLIAHLGMGSL